MTLYIKLDQSINPKKLLHDIHQEIAREKKDNGDILKIEVKHVTEAVEEITREQVKRYLENK